MALGNEWDVLEWQRQYDAQQRRACDAEAEVERLREALATREEQLAIKDEQIRKLTNRVNKLGSQLNKCRHQIRPMQAENGDLREQLANARAELRNGHKALTAAGIPEADDSGALSVTGRVMRLRQQLAAAQAVCQRAIETWDADSAGPGCTEKDMLQQLRAIRDRSIDHAALNAALAAARREALSAAAELCAERGEILDIAADERLPAQTIARRQYAAWILLEAADAIRALLLEEDDGNNA